MDAIPASSELPIRPLLRACVEEARIPGQRHGDRAAVEQLDLQLILCNLGVHDLLARTHGPCPFTLMLSPGRQECHLVLGEESLNRPKLFLILAEPVGDCKETAIRVAAGPVHRGPRSGSARSPWCATGYRLKSPEPWPVLGPSRRWPRQEYRQSRSPATS